MSNALYYISMEQEGVGVVVDAWHVALSIGAVAATAGAQAYAAVAIVFALFAAFYLALYIFWYLGNK